MGPQYESVADYVVKFGFLFFWEVLYKEPKKKTSPFVCYVNFGFPQRKKVGIFLIMGDAEKSHKCRIIVNVH